MLRKFWSNFKDIPVRIVLYMLSLIGLIIVAWPPAYYFLNDDLIHIPLSAEGQIGQHNSVRFIGDLSLMADYALSKSAATGYHITNLILHLFNFLLVFFILKHPATGLKREKEKWLILFSVICFGWFGFHGDALFWIIGRSALLGALFMFLTIYCFLQRKKHPLWMTAMAISWLFALFSYESVWFFPALLLGAKIFLKPSKMQSLYPDNKSILLICGIFTGYLIVRYFFTGSFLGSYEASAFETFSIKTLGLNYVKLILRTFSPPNNNITIFFIISLVLVFAYMWAIVLLHKAKRLNRTWVLLHACWLISYLPYLSLGINLRTMESERFLYLPSAFFIVALGYSLFQVLYAVRKKIILVVIIIAFVCTHIGFTVYRGIVFRHAGNLVKSTFIELQKTPLPDTLFVKGLPTVLHGIPIFRIGFEEGYAWLVKDSTRIIVRDYLPPANTIPKPVVVSSVGLSRTLSFKTP